MKPWADSSLSAAPVLEYADVRRGFGAGRAVLDGFTLTVRGGETVALVGPSGCGKTTALKLANRLLDADAGSVRIFGRPAAEHDPVALRRRIGYVIQEGGLFPHWTVRENVRANLRVIIKRILRKHGYPPDKQAKATELVLEQAEALSRGWANQMEVTCTTQ